jgi:hypothetical protein
MDHRGLLETDTGFRRIKGYTDMPTADRRIG